MNRIVDLVNYVKDEWHKHRKSTFTKKVYVLFIEAFKPQLENHLKKNS